MDTQLFNNFILPYIEEVGDNLRSITIAQGVTFVILLALNIITSKFSLSKYIYSFIRKVLLWRQNFLIRFPFGYSYTKFLWFKTIHRKKTSWKIPGFICLLSSSVGKMENMTTAGITMKIHLSDYGDKYDKRSIEVNEERINQSVNQIRDYYSQLEQELQKKNLYSDDLFYYQDEKGYRSVIDILKDIYSPDNIKNAIMELNEDAIRNKALHFNGDKIGICGYRMKMNIFRPNSFTLKIYETDHFSFLIFKKIYKDDRFQEFFQQMILRANTLSHTKKQYLVSCLAFVFSSFGLDIAVDGYTASKKKKMLLAIRSKAVESSNRSSIHVPVNECFSKTDLVNDNKEYSLEECVKRGVEEEIGIDRNKINDIRFYDFAIVTDEGEIGISCRATIDHHIPLEKALLYPGQDKYLEISELLIVPIPSIFMNEKKYPNHFYRLASNDKLSFIWQSFTPLLYRRAVLHNIKESTYSEYFINFLLSVILYSWLSMNDASLSAIVFFIVMCLLTYIGHSFKYASRYKSVVPFVPQWNGDVSVLQATGMQSFKEEHSVEKNLLVKGMTFGIHPELFQTPLKIEDLYLKDLPKCCVRRERTDQSECPLSFYRMKKRKPTINYRNNKLLLYEIPYQNSGNGIISLYLSVKKIQNTGKIEYSFTRPVGSSESPILTEITEKKETFLSPYSNYFKVDKSLLSQLDYYKIDTDSKLYNKGSQSFTDLWSFADLFECDGNYCWSLVRKDHLYSYRYDQEFFIDKKFSLNAFYKQYIALGTNMQKDEHIIKITGTSKMVERFLNQFTAHPSNRQKITDRDIYMLQLLLIRWGITYANLKYRKLHF